MPWRESVKERQAFAAVRKAENDYGRRLRQVAQQFGNFVKGFAPHGPEFSVDLAHLQFLLERYSDLLDPWARAVATRFVAEVGRRDERAWATYSQKFSRSLEQEIRTAPTGQMLSQFLETQVELIKSIPLKAAERVHEIAIGNLYSGERYTDLLQHIMDTGQVSASRATLIARTETGRVSSALTMVRAEHIGSEGYIWRTIRDNVVRPSHRRMEGKFCRWDDPPVVEAGKPPYHAGMIYNCRCFAEPVIPERYLPDKKAA
jgi:SPP1 gp7 family putative phage head morphogenesis protein